MNIDTLPEVPGADRVFGHLRALRTDRLRFFEAAREVGPLAQLRLLGTPNGPAGRALAAKCRSGG